MELENRQICRDVAPRCILMSAWELASAFAICFREIKAFLVSHAETKMILMRKSEFATCWWEERYSCGFMVGEPERNRPLRRPTYILEDNIKIYIRALIGSIWLGLRIIGGLLWVRYLTIKSYKILLVSWLAPQEVLVHGVGLLVGWLIGWLVKGSLHQLHIWILIIIIIIIIILLTANW